MHYAIDVKSKLLAKQYDDLNDVLTARSLWRLLRQRGNEAATDAENDDNDVDDGDSDEEKEHNDGDDHNDDHDFDV